jgi:hypothetical protein
VMVTLAVTQGWEWPLLGSTRAGIAALGVIGIFGCATSGSANTPETFKGPFVMLAAALGVVALGLVVFGLIYGTEALLTALTIDIVLLWIVTTLHHATSTFGSHHRHAAHAA